MPTMCGPFSCKLLHDIYLSSWQNRDSKQKLPIEWHILNREEKAKHNAAMNYTHVQRGIFTTLQCQTVKILIYNYFYCHSIHTNQRQWFFYFHFHMCCWARVLFFQFPEMLSMMIGLVVQFKKKNRDITWMDDASLGSFNKEKAKNHFSCPRWWQENQNLTKAYVLYFTVTVVFFLSFHCSITFRDCVLFILRSNWWQRFCHMVLHEGYCDVKADSC